MRRSKNVGVALIGLLVVAAISVAAASGRKPAREERAKTSARVLTNTEADQLGRRFPGLRARTQVTGELLERLFPNTAFYRALYSYRGARVAYLTATSDTGLLTMPDGFNRLLRAYNMEVNDKNKVELAKAFVLTAIGNRPTTDPETEYPVGLDSFPPIIFLDASVTKHRIGLYSYDVELKVRIGEQVEDWCFPVGQGQFGLVLRRDARGNTIRFYNPVVDDPLPSRGQLDPDPNMDIVGDAYVEYDTLFQPWYYVTVDTNSSPTHDTVVFSLSGFPPESTNVYVAVFDPIRHANRYIHRVQMNSGSGSDTWEPPQDSTGICNASAGYADTSDPERTYVGIPSTAKVLTIERLKTGTFPGADTELLKVYFCDQFFQSLPGGEAHAPVFAQYARSAIFESWQTQVNAWGLGMPADADHIHQVFINDGTYWYHTLPVTWTEFGREQKIGIQSRLWYRKHNDSTYSSESTRVNAAAAHEFYHGVQWGLDSTKVKDSTWNWFTEAQARFIQSAQYQGGVQQDRRADCGTAAVSKRREQVPHWIPEHFPQNTLQLSSNGLSLLPLLAVHV